MNTTKKSMQVWIVRKLRSMPRGALGRLAAVILIFAIAAPAAGAATIVASLKPTFQADLTTTLKLQAGSGSPTFTRATTAYQTDFEGKLNQSLSGEARFQGARRVQNLYTSSATLATQGITTIAGKYTVSFTGTGTITFSGTFTGSLVGTGASTRVSTTFTTTAGTLTSTVTGTVTNAQAENVTGQTNQNPSEYVSVGANSAPYHGAGVDGVQYFNTQNGNTVASNVVTAGTGAKIVANAATGGDSVSNIMVGNVMYRVHTFTTVGNSTFTVPAGLTNVEYLVVAGGGAGGGSYGGGGGAGGYLTGTATFSSATSMTVTVGSGGSGGYIINGNPGQNSSFGGIAVAVGGGGGRSANLAVPANGGSGGGGAGTDATAQGAASGTAGQGNAGGTGRNQSNRSDGGGGGGAGAVGADAPFNDGGDGGVGLSSSIDGFATYRAGGGGGGGYSDSAGAGGNGGGGAGSITGTGTAGTANTGGGGGGGIPTNIGGAGGSGIVIVRYKAGATINAPTNTSSTNGLVGLWSFDGKDMQWTSATTGFALDRSGQGNNGTLVSMSQSASPTIGKIGQALKFDGSTSYVSVANTITARSVAFWIKPTTNTASMLNLTATAYITAAGGVISATGFTSPTTYVNGVSGATTLTAGVWNHIVVTDTANTTANAITIGKANGAYTTGSIDDVRIYSRALSAAEVKSLYNLGR